MQRKSAATPKSLRWTTTAASVMKYAALQDYLKAITSTREHVTLSFDEIEKIIGAALSRSAFTYREWWALTFSPQGYQFQRDKTSYQAAFDSNTLGA